MTTLRVLLVEDEELIRWVAAEILRGEGYNVVEAQNANDAIVLLKQQPFDVVFTDVRMPGNRDGVDVALHARQQFQMMPILVASGHVANLPERLAELDPAAVFFSKPYSMSEIVRVLSHMTLAQPNRS
jgi:CheY-like chemotaxis protein